MHWLTEATDADLALLAKIKQCSVIIEGRLKGGVHTHIFFTLCGGEIEERRGLFGLKRFYIFTDSEKKEKYNS